METSSKDHLDNDEVNQAAYNFKKGLGLAKSMMGHKALSAKGIARVMSAILEFPLQDKDPKFTNKVEEQLFILTLQVLSAKSTMLNAVVEHKKESASAEGVSNV